MRTWENLNMVSWMLVGHCTVVADGTLQRSLTIEQHLSVYYMDTRRLRNTPLLVNDIGPCLLLTDAPYRHK